MGIGINYLLQSLFLFHFKLSDCFVILLNRLASVIVLIPNTYFVARKPLTIIVHKKGTSNLFVCFLNEKLTKRFLYFQVSKIKDKIIPLGNPMKARMDHGNDWI